MRLDDVVSHVRTQLRFPISQEGADYLIGEGFTNHYQAEYNIMFLDIQLEEANKLYNLDSRIVNVLQKTFLDNVGQAGGGPQPVPCLMVSEWGLYNLDEQYGKSQVACGKAGYPLRPFWLGDKPEQNHATFTVSHGCILCLAAAHTDSRLNLDIFEVDFLLEPSLDIIQLRVSSVWSGARFYEAPRRYVAPMACAVAKAFTENCSGAAFYTKRYYNRQDEEMNQD